MSQVFLKRGDFYTSTEGNFDVMPNLDDGVYQIHQNPITGEIFLERLTDKFYFGFKLYGIDEVFVNHVLDTYSKQTSKHNIGVLLNGAKGTGKTVTAKMLCNKLGLPVLIVDRPLAGLSNFLASINHDCVFLFDEFEKNFKMVDEDGENNAGESLLSIMDGVYNGENCHIFIMTTNSLKVNDNLLSRPSRIRYLKSFGDVISHDLMEEYINDNLKHMEYKEELIEFFETLTIGTIDILKSLVEEINIHNCSVSEFKGFFNVKEAYYHYNCRSWRVDLSDEEHPTFNEFIKHAKAPYTKDLDWRPNFTILKLKKSIRKYKEGDFVDSRHKIKEIHFDKSGIIVEDTRYKENLTYYFFENLDEKPSIYDTTYRTTYGYYEDEFDSFLT